MQDALGEFIGRVGAAGAAASTAGAAMANAAGAGGTLALGTPAPPFAASAPPGALGPGSAWPPGSRGVACA